MVKLPQFQPLLRRETRPAQADGVQSANPIVPARDRERRQVFADGRAALHDGQRADTRELMHEAVAGNERAILHRHMAAEQRAIGNNDVVAQLRIVADVTVCHQKIMRTDNGLAVRPGRAMHRDMFAEDIVGADAQTRRFVLVFQILRRIADDAPGVEFIVRTDFGDASQINVWPDDAMHAEFHARANHGIWPDAGGRIQPGLRMNDGGRMDHFCDHRFTQICRD